MKRVGLLFSAVLLVCALSNAANAIPYTHTIDFTEENVLNGIGVFSWSHDLPTDFSVPYDTVNSASLVITSRRAEDNNDIVSIFDFGDLGSLNPSSGNSGNNSVSTTFDGLAGTDLFLSWEAGKTLDLLLSYNQGTGNSDTLTMVSSVLSLDYDNVSSPVPEPCTLVLLGVGLGGLAIARRSRKY